MKKSPYRVVLVTASGRRQADRLARMLVSEKLAACVNVVPKISSRYRWRGKIETASESLLLIKTKAALLPRLTRRVQAIHSYTVPEIIALPILEGNPDYLDWMDGAVSARRS